MPFDNTPSPEHDPDWWARRRLGQYARSAAGVTITAIGIALALIGWLGFMALAVLAR